MTQSLLPNIPVSLRSAPAFSDGELTNLSASFEAMSPHSVVAWASETFGARLVLTASFANTLLIQVATEVDPDIEVVFIDTGFHFAETLATVRLALDRYSLNLPVLQPHLDAPDVWATNSDSCCGARKVAPLERFLASRADAWMSGLRRDDNSGRASAPIVGRDRRGIIKINPLAVWSTEQLDRYSLSNDVLINPLMLKGYPSVGCWPCTDPASGDDTRAGRWAGSTKTECGLHQ